MKHLAFLVFLLALAVSVRAEQQLPADTAGDPNVPSVSAFEAERYVGREVIVTGEPPCVDFIENSLNYGLLDRRKKTVFRVVVRIPGIDTRDYLRKLAGGRAFTVRGRIEWDPPFKKGILMGWDWEGGPQIVVTTQDQIRFGVHPK